MMLNPLRRSATATFLHISAIARRRMLMIRQCMDSSHVRFRELSLFN